MSVVEFIRQVKLMADKADINFLLIAGGQVAFRGPMDEIMSKDGVFNPTITDSTIETKDASETWGDLYDLIAGIPGDEAMKVSTKDIPNFNVFTSTDYYMLVSSNRKSFEIIAGEFGEEGIPMIEATKNNDDSVTVATIQKLSKNDDEDMIVTDRTSTIHTDIRIRGSLSRNTNIPTHICAEIEAFIVSIIQISNS